MGGWIGKVSANIDDDTVAEWDRAPFSRFSTEGFLALPVDLAPKLLVASVRDGEDLGCHLCQLALLDMAIEMAAQVCTAEWAVRHRALCLLVMRALNGGSRSTSRGQHRGRR